MKKLSIVLIALLCLSLSACSGNERLTHMTVVQALGIDYQGGKFTLTVQYLDISRGTGSKEGISGNITAVEQASGNSIYNALGELENKLSERLFFGQNKLVVLGSDTEEKAAESLKEFLLNTEYTRPDVFIVKCTSAAADAVKCKERTARVPAEKICRQLEYYEISFNACDYLKGERKIPVIEVKDGYTVAAE